MKIVTIIGARPQFIKAATVSRIIKNQSLIKEVIVHTGQHYDHNMSEVFFEELEIPKPSYNLGVGGGPHGWMTGRQLEGIEKILLEEMPDFVLVYGDTNSTLAGSLAAVKLHIPVAHVEAGLRSFNRAMPEEINRVLTDQVSALLFCPTLLAVRNLAQEGITSGVHHVGDVMYDAALGFGGIANQRSTILNDLGISLKRFFLATVHRAENTDNPGRLQNLFEAFLELADVDNTIVLPLHPRTRGRLEQMGLWSRIQLNPNLKVIAPVSFLDMVMLEKSSRLILTDSGGVQKEAYFHGVPCVTLRDETEWFETVDAGWNIIASANKQRILAAVKSAPLVEKRCITEYGEGHAAEKIVELLMSAIKEHLCEK